MENILSFLINKKGNQKHGKNNRKVVGIIVVLTLLLASTAGTVLSANSYVDNEITTVSNCSNTENNKQITNQRSMLFQSESTLNFAIHSMDEKPYFEHTPPDITTSSSAHSNLMSTANENSTVCGYVTDVDTGLPIENADVNLDWHDDEYNWDWNSTTTNASGYYCIHVAEGHLRLNADADGYYSAQTDWYMINEYEMLQIDIMLDPEPDENSQVCGYIDDFMTGLPIENVWIHLEWQDNQGHQDWNSTQTNASGFYCINIAAGDVQLSINHDEYFGEFIDWFTVGEYEVVWMNISLYPRPPENAVVCGYVNDSVSGFPIQDVWINLEWQDSQGHWDWNSTPTDTSGFYCMNVAAGEFDLSFYHDEYYYARSEDHVIEEYEILWVNMSLQPCPPQNAQVCGYVIDGATSLPIEDAEVSLYWHDDYGNDEWNGTSTDSSGYYSMNVAAGEFYVLAQKTGYTRNASDWTTIEAYQLLWFNFSIEEDVTPPEISNIVIPDFVGINHPGDIGAEVHDDHLHVVHLFLVDYYNLTFNESIVIWYYLDDTGTNDTYAIRDYTGIYAELSQNSKTITTTALTLLDWIETNQVYTLAAFQQNPSAQFEQTILEFNLTTGHLTDLAIPAFTPTGVLQFDSIADQIESGVSIIIPMALTVDGGWVADPNFNFTLYTIGDPNNPTLGWQPLLPGIYGGQVLAEDWAYHQNATQFEFTVFHDYVKPKITDNTPSTATGGEPFTFNATVTDNIEVASVWVEYWYDDGVHTNDSMTNTADDYWEHTITVEPYRDVLHYIIAAVDTSNNLNNTSINDVPIETILVPDLDCVGDLSWTDVEPGSLVTGDIFVLNEGDPESLLDWEVESWHQYCLNRYIVNASVV
jgi:5-hydroxyisourate hydrolase-like protein (transthyretin family)